MKDASSKGKSNPLWSSLASVKLTIALLIILAILSILGTLIPQQRDAVEFAGRLSPTLRQILLFLDLFDMYHSSWFRVLLGLLSLNLVVCSLDRFPATWRRFSARPEPDRKKPFEDLPEGQSCLTEEPPERTAARVGRLLRSRYRNMREKEGEAGFYFYAEKGGLSHFGVYVVHLSVLLILVGGLVGSLLGFEAQVNILEGEQTDTIMLRKRREPLKLPFEVRCDRFLVEFYDTGAPKEYRSDLTFLVDGRETHRAALRVNHPVEFMGVTFYQSTYGAVPGKHVHLRLVGPNGETQALPLKAELDKPVTLPGNEGSFRVVEARGDILNTGPAVLISAQTAGQREPIEFWVFQNEKEALSRLPAPMRQSSKFNASAVKPYTFILEGLETRFYTGLQVNRDPGVPIVWLGCFLIVGGLFLTFFASHRRIWVRILPAGGGSRVEVAGMASKNPVGLERELDRLMTEIRKRDNQDPIAGPDFNRRGGQT